MELIPVGYEQTVAIRTHRGERITLLLTGLIRLHINGVDHVGWFGMNAYDPAGVNRGISTQVYDLTMEDSETNLEVENLNVGPTPGSNYPLIPAILRSEPPLSRDRSQARHRESEIQLPIDPPPRRARVRGDEEREQAKHHINQQVK
jgi:hypothetical protein